MYLWILITSILVLCDNRKYVINCSNKYYRNRDQSIDYTGNFDFACIKSAIPEINFHVYKCSRL